LITGGEILTVDTCDLLKKKKMSLEETYFKCHAYSEQLHNALYKGYLRRIKLFVNHLKVLRFLVLAGHSSFSHTYLASSAGVGVGSLMDSLTLVSVALAYLLLL
jgi:hypothetical protein